ncbi:MAG TPA: NEW3 domain-containing protein, partial [Pseudonocardiaceae bacterium]
MPSTPTTRQRSRPHAVPVEHRAPTRRSLADTLYTSLLNATNAGLAANEQANGFDFLPCEVNKPVTADRCNSSNDANWAGSNLWGQNVWDIYLQGGQLGGILGDPQQTDNLYQTGYARLAGALPFPTLGAYSGYSTAHNTGYTAASLYGSQYRDLPLTSYAWQLQTTTGGPNAWWEANGSAPSANNPWAGSHAAPQFGAIPYAWPMAGQTQTVLQSLVASGLVSTTRPDGSFDYHTALYLGRGVPDAWIVPGQSIAVDNLTSSYRADSGHRTTYGMRIATGWQQGDRVVWVGLTGQPPTTDVRVQLPVFADAGVLGVTGGSYDPITHTVTMPGHGPVLVRLGHAARPTVGLDVASTVPGQHTRPALTAGTPTTASATFTNTGQDTLGNVRLNLPAPAGWTVTPSTTTAFPGVAPGQTVTATWAVTPPATMNGSNGLRVAADYAAPDSGAFGSVSALRWVDVRRPLPLPPGSTNLAPSATPSASYTSPWENVTAINDGIYPTSSNDSQDLRWGTWPMQGTQWIELDWTTPVTANGGAVYFLDDGGGVRLPASWTVQYWNGSAFVDVPNPSGYPIADDGFNSVTFDPVTT